MSTDLEVPKPPSTKALTTGAMVLTVIYISLLGGLCWWRWYEIKAMGLPDLATAVSGALSPLALAWLVVGYFQQGTELKLNTQALMLQGQELARSVAEQQRSNEHQSELVRVGQDQLKVQLEQVEADRKAERARTSPHFMSIDMGQDRTNNLITRFFDFQNAGVAARAVELWTDTELGSGKRQLLPIVESRGKVHGELRYASGTLPVGKCAYLAYTDATGDRWQHTFLTWAPETADHKDARLELRDLGAKPVTPPPVAHLVATEGIPPPS